MVVRVISVSRLSSASSNRFLEEWQALLQQPFLGLINPGEVVHGFERLRVSLSQCFDGEGIRFLAERRGIVQPVAQFEGSARLFMVMIVSGIPGGRIFSWRLSVFPYCSIAFWRSLTSK